VAGPKKIALAGLFLLVLEKSSNAAFLNPSLHSHGITPGFIPFRPHQIPRPGKNFGGPATVVIRVVVLADAADKVIGLAAIIAAGGLTLKDVDVKGHKKSPVVLATGLFKVAPQSRKKWALERIIIHRP
jgi:hypothetical protein